MDYLIPTAMEVPEIEIHHVETPTDIEINYRGVGEGGMIVAPAALTNAIEDALAHLGVRITEQHLPPTRILELAGVIAPDVVIPFVDWLAGQTRRRDAIGDLARDTRRDVTWPPRGKVSRAKLRAHLEATRRDPRCARRARRRVGRVGCAAPRGARRLMAHLDAALALEPDGEGRWRAHADADHESISAMFGGWTAAVLLRAVLATAASDAQPSALDGQLHPADRAGQRRDHHRVAPRRRTVAGALARRRAAPTDAELLATALVVLSNRRDDRRAPAVRDAGGARARQARADPRAGAAG